MSLFCHIKSDKKVTKTKMWQKSDFSDRVTSGSSTAQISTTHKKNYQYNLLKEEIVNTKSNTMDERRWVNPFLPYYQAT